MEENKLNKLIEDKIKEMVPEILRTSFSVKKITDTPTDDLQVVPRKYVNMNGSVVSRPNSSVATMGQFYFAIDTGIPMRYNRSSSVWVNGSGSTVAQG